MTRPSTAIALLLSVLASLLLVLTSAAGAAEPSAPAPAGQGSETTVPAPPPAPPTTPEAPATPTTATPGQAPGAAEGSLPQVRRQIPQIATPGAPARHAPSTAGAGGSSAPAGTGEAEAGPTGARPKALAPTALTPSLPGGLGTLTGLPSFFIESFGVPPFLLPIFQAAGTAYGVPWQVLAAINEVESDYGRDLSVSSAGAEGWMQFLPAEWAQYGLDANGDGYKDPYNPADAIFAAARYLRAAGGASNIRAAVFAYNHSPAYVDSVMLRAQLLGGTPGELLGAITALTEAHFPVHAAAHFSDGFPTVADGRSGTSTLVGSTIYSQAGAPVIAVQDGEVLQIGQSPALGRFLVLRDAYGNTYTYGDLGDVASLYPVLEPHVDTTVSPRIDSGSRAHEAAPRGPATAGVQARSPISEGATVSGLALGAAAGLEAAAPAPSVSSPSAPSRPAPSARVFRSGAEDVYLHPLRAGVQLIAGTVLGHVGATGGSEPHIVFQIRPAGLGAPPIDPKPILDGWVALENTSIFRAKGENPFLATSPTVGQVLLESKQQLEPQVLHDRGIELDRCGRQDVQAGRVDKRVLALLEYMSVSGLRPTVSGLRCVTGSQAASAANAPDAASAVEFEITAVDGTPLAGHQGSGSIGDITVRRLLMLQGAARPQRIVSLLEFPGSRVAIARPAASRAIVVAYPRPGGSAHAAGASDSILSAREWVRLIARLGEIPDPTVAHAPSAAAIPDGTTTGGGTERRVGGNH